MKFETFHAGQNSHTMNENENKTMFIVILTHIIGRRACMSSPPSIKHVRFGKAFASMPLLPSGLNSSVNFNSILVRANDDFMHVD